MLATIGIVMAIYFIAMIAISWMGKKHASSFNDYLVAGKSCGIIMIIGAAAGAHLGNGLVVGGAGEGSVVGFSGIAFGLGCCLSYLIMPSLMSKFVYSHGYLSMAEYLRERYDNSELIAQIYNIATIGSAMGLIAGQLTAGGALFEALGFNRLLGIVIIGVVVFAYSVVQTVVILIGVGSAAIFVLQSGGWGEITAAVEAGTVPETFTHPFAGYTASALVGLIVPVSLQSLTDQAVFQRILSAKTEPTFRYGHYIAAAVMLPAIMAPVLIGMYGRVHMGLTGNSAFFGVILDVLPPLLAALVVTAAIAAVMSTIDCFIIAFSQCLLNDLYKKHINKTATDAQLNKLTLPLNIVLIVCCIAMAATGASVISLLSMSYLFIEAAILVPFMGAASGPEATDTAPSPPLWWGSSLPCWKLPAYLCCPTRPSPSSFPPGSPLSRSAWPRNTKPGSPRPQNKIGPHTLLSAHRDILRDVPVGVLRPDSLPPVPKPRTAEAAEGVPRRAQVFRGTAFISSPAAFLLPPAVV